MKKLSLLSVLALMFVVNTAQAGILIDPYIGTGQFTSTFDSNLGQENKTETYTATGARLGYTFLLFSVGIDYQMGSTKLAKETFKSNSTSVFVGVDLPILLRAWAEYFLSSSVDSNDANIDSNLSFKNGYSVGVGFTGLPFISVNAELQNINYEYDGGGLKGDVATANTVLSISLPLKF